MKLKINFALLALALCALPASLLAQIGVYITSDANISIAEGTQIVVLGNVEVEKGAKVSGKIQQVSKNPVRKGSELKVTRKTEVKSQVPSASVSDRQEFLDDSGTKWTGISRFRKAPLNGQSSSCFWSASSSFNAIMPDFQDNDEHFSEVFNFRSETEMESGSITTNFILDLCSFRMGKLLNKALPVKCPSRILQSRTDFQNTAELHFLKNFSGFSVFFISKYQSNLNIAPKC